VHLLVLLGWISQVSEPFEPVMPPAVVGLLVAPPATAPTPLPVVVPPQHPTQPVVRRQVQSSLPEAEPSERAVSAPASVPTGALTSTEPLLAAVPEPTVAPVAPPVAAITLEPVVAPRTDAAHLNHPATYPPISKRLGEQGVVQLEVQVLVDGTVGQLKLKRSSGYVRLDEAALSAVRHWRYLPARRGDQAIAAWYVQPVSFSLDD
jgi:periplasmic protein TonB